MERGASPAVADANERRIAVDQLADARKITRLGSDVNGMIRVRWRHGDAAGLLAGLLDKRRDLGMTAIAGHVDERVAVDVHAIGPSAGVDQPAHFLDVAL